MKLTKREAKISALRLAAGSLAHTADCKLMAVKEDGCDYEHNDDLVRAELRAIAAGLEVRLERFKETKK